MGVFSVWVNHSIEAEEVDFFTALTTAFKAFERGEPSVNVYANGPEEQRAQAEGVMDALMAMQEEQEESLLAQREAQREEELYYKEGRE